MWRQVLLSDDRSGSRRPHFCDIGHTNFLCNRESKHAEAIYEENSVVCSVNSGQRRSRECWRRPRRGQGGEVYREDRHSARAASREGHQSSRPRRGLSGLVISCISASVRGGPARSTWTPYLFPCLYRSRHGVFTLGGRVTYVLI